MNVNLMPFFWVAISLPILLIVQRWIHRHLHGLAYLITGNKSVAVVTYAIILFPGVLLHELSHWLTANLLGVRTGSFSILPKSNADGSIQLGYVEYYKTKSVGPIRESLIGSAPLVTGTAVILLIAFQIFEVSNLVSAIQAGDATLLIEALSDLFATPDVLIWLYLLFAVGNAMMPSASDRRAWPAFAVIMALVAIVLFLLGLQDVLLEEIAGPATVVFGYLGLAYSIIIGVDLVVSFLIFLAESIISRIRGVDIVYGKTPPQS